MAETSKTEWTEGAIIGGKRVEYWNATEDYDDDHIERPLRWKRPRMIIVCAHGDLFHESVPDEWIDRVFAVMASAPQHTFQVLTKRSARMRAYFRKVEQDGPAERIMDAAYDLGIDDDGCCAIANWINGFSRWRDAPEDGNPLDGTIRRWPLATVWLGVSAEDQTRADERIPDLLATPAAIRFVSAEPLLGPIDFFRLDRSDWHDFHTGEKKINYADVLNGFRYNGPYSSFAASFKTATAKLDWVIVGGESGPKARPMNPQWARDIRDQCAAADVPFFFKQNGEWVPVSEVEGPGEHYHFPDGRTVRRTGKALAGKTLDGREHSEFPDACELRKNR